MIITLDSSSPKIATSSPGLSPADPGYDNEHIEIFYGNIETNILGEVFIAVKSNRVIKVDFGVTTKQFIEKVRTAHGNKPANSQEHTSFAQNQVKEYLNGERKYFDLILDLGQLTIFQKEVLKATCNVPYGETATYKCVAEKIQNPRAVRAVGQALGKNPIPIIIPCHRVIASGGKPGGYSGGGGILAKQKLIDLERNLI